MALFDENRPHKTIVVVSAAVLFDGETVCLARRLGGRAFAGFWEFPGGKVEPGETPEAALHRELEEELAVRIEAPLEKGVSWYSYPDREIKVIFYSADIATRNYVLTAHDTLRWLNEAELRSFALGPERSRIIPPDVPIVDQILRDGFEQFRSIGK